MVLFTVAEFKESERITGTADDAQIASLATAVSAAVDKYLRRTVEAGPIDEVEYYDGSGTASLFVRKPPIISVTSVHVDSSRAWDASTSVPASSFVIYRDEGRLSMLPSSGIGTLFGENGIWPKGTLNVRVIYRGGWVEVPADITMAAILWASILYRPVGGRRSDVISRSIGSWSESYAGAASHRIPDGVRSMLAPYRLPLTLTGVSR